MKALRYSGATAVAMLAMLAAFLAWEAAFASLVGLQTHSWALWSRFYHGLEWSLADPHRLCAMVSAAGPENFGTGVARGLGRRGRRQLRHPRDRPELPRRAPPCRRLASGHPIGSETRGASERQARLFGVPRPLSGQGPALYRREPHLRQWPDPLGQGRRLRPAERPRMARLSDRPRSEARDVERDRRRPRRDGPGRVPVLAGLARIPLLESRSTSCRPGPSGRRTSRTSRAA